MLEDFFSSPPQFWELREREKKKSPLEEVVLQKGQKGGVATQKGGPCKKPTGEVWAVKISKGEVLTARSTRREVWTVKISKGKVLIGQDERPRRSLRTRRGPERSERTEREESNARARTTTNKLNLGLIEVWFSHFKHANFRKPQVKLWLLNKTKWFFFKKKKTF